MSEIKIDPANPRYPGVFVQLSGQDGNIGSIMGRVARELKEQDATADEINEFRTGFFECGSYDEALAWVMSWVEVG